MNTDFMYRVNVRCSGFICNDILAYFDRYDDALDYVKNINRMYLDNYDTAEIWHNGELLFTCDVSGR